MAFTQRCAAGAVVLFRPQNHTCEMQATLDWAAKDGDRSAVTCKVGEDEVLICSLRGGSLESVAMDLVFDHYTGANWADL